jgi:hypothetical protein
MKIIECVQGTPEWLHARLGIPTASEMDALVSPEGKIRTGQGPETYLYKKLCERILGFSNDNANSFAMAQGSILETEAAPWYSFTNDIEVKKVGLCTTDDGRVGASPDGLIGTNGGLEIKCFQPEHSLRCLMENAVPKEYALQIQTCLYVTQREWWDFLSYSRQFPALVIRVYPDAELQEAIRQALDKFLTKFDYAYAKVKAMKDAENALKNAEYEKSNNPGIKP